MSESHVIQVKSNQGTPSTTPRHDKEKASNEQNPFSEPPHEQEANRAGEGHATPPAATEGQEASAPAEPKKKSECCACCDAQTMFQWFYRVFKLIVICALFLMGAASALLCLSFHESNSLDDIATGFGVLAQAGFIVLVLVLVIAEFGPKWFLKYFFLFNFWAGRGLALIWMGIESIGNVESLGSVMATTNATVPPYTIQIVGRVSGWSLIATGILYVFMSMFCMRILGFKKNESTDEEAEPDHNADTAAKDNALPAAQPKQIKESRDSKHSWTELEKDDKFHVATHAAVALGMTLPEMIALFTGANGEHNAHAHFEQEEAKKRKAAQPATPQANNSSPKEKETENEGMSLEDRYYAAQNTGVVN